MDNNMGAEEKAPKSFWFVWSARIISLVVLLLIMIVGVFAFGYADSGVKIKVSHQIDDVFLLSQANVLSGVNFEKETSESLKIPEGQNIYSYVSDIKQAEKDFWMVGAKISSQKVDNTTIEGKIRASRDGENWSDWYDLDLDRNGSQNEVDTEVPVLFEKKYRYVQYSLVLSTEDIYKTPVVDNVNLVFIDPDDKFAFVKKGWGWLTEKVMGKEKVDIITRDEWGADESIMTWDDLEYAPVEQIIVHHTAGSNNSPLDSAAVVRGIYYFHAVEKDWGDIGYNYIVDHRGNIYEGRKGGMGVVAAHASGNNYGSTGIALIGNYVDKAPSSNALTGLISIIEYVGYQADLNLTGRHNFEGKNIPVVAGHRDVNSTECPGEVLYSMLSDIALAAENGSAILPQKTYEAIYVSQSVDEIDLKSGETETVVVRFENTGSAVWLKGSDDVVLVPIDPLMRESGFEAYNWESGSEVGSVSQITVMPGEKAVFELDLKGIDQTGEYVEKFGLKNENGLMPGTEFAIIVRNQKVDNFVEDNREVDDKERIIDEQPEETSTGSSEQTVDSDWYHAEWVAQSDHVELFPGEETTVWVDFKNTGKTPWYKDGDFPVRLGTSNTQDRDSGFYGDGSWLAANRIEMSSWSVEPGELARFRFVIKAGNQLGIFDEYFQPVVESVTWMEDFGVYARVTVREPEFRAQWVDQSENPITLSPGKKARLWVELENVGNVVWRKDGDSPVRLGTDHDLDRTSDFYSPGFWISSNRAAGMKKNTANPGDTVRFEVVVTAPRDSGVYRESFRPVVENLRWMDDLGIYWEIEVE
ncbi:N-acetylmuramoyl-L-alanine amidase [Patescibacteria group bacterium]|nr:N-acetylmuramoyl-L-alanine amidase [Patescibacteria group bacterium]